MKKVIAVILFILFCLFIRIAVGELCIVPSGSMEPTLLCGDRVWIDKITYGARFPARWADIPVINVFTWIRPLREMDRNTHWKYSGFQQSGKYGPIISKANYSDKERE